MFAATLLLGIGFYSYIAAVLMAPIYLLFTAALLFHARKPVRDYAVAAAGFALPQATVVPKTERSSEKSTISTWF